MPPKIYFEDVSVDLPDLSSVLNDHEKILAAGGVVLNDNNEILFIFRRGKWDLPKGKWEEGESLEDCALRETEEETGVRNLTLEHHLLTTYHTYRERSVEILKETHWYLLRAAGVQQLTPQEAEDITTIEWVSGSALKKYLDNTYALIFDVLAAAGFTP